MVNKAANDNPVDVRKAFAGFLILIGLGLLVSAWVSFIGYLIVSGSVYTIMGLIGVALTLLVSGYFLSGSKKHGVTNPDGNKKHDEVV